ncbi:S-layer homology domain-containing protein [Clostridiaceae bacterium HSG29]|nr:S-layer homology domain-containing protein [Clostridiaceae bacterium HSG29]
MFKNKIISVVLVLLLISVPMSFAVSEFSDVTSEFWGYNIIQKVSANSVMEGFDDGNFYPSNEATKLEAILTIYKAMKNNKVLNIDDVTALVNEYKSVMEEIGIPPMLAPYSNGEVYPAVAFALKNNIITESELKYFIEDSKLSSVSKIEVSVFYAKALNLVKKENLYDDIISFDYKDQFEITKVAAPYVDLLIKHNIVSDKGDSEGKFNPNQVLNRVVLAVFANGFDSAIKNSDVPSENTETKIGNIIEASGKISYIHEAMNIIEIKDNNNSSHVYDLDNTKVNINGNKANISNLEALQSVTYSYQDDKIIEINVTQTYEKIEGTIIKLSKKFVTDVESYQVMAITDIDGNNKYLKIFESTYVKIDEKESSVENLIENYKVVVDYSGLDAKIIKAYSENSILTGVLTRPVDANNVVKVELSDGTEFIGSAENIDEAVQRGEIVKLYLNYGKIVKVESTGKKSVVSGTISEIVISNTPSIVIVKENGLSERFTILDSTEIVDFNTDEDLGIYDLRLSRTCELNVNAMGISKISLVKPVEEIKFSGVVENIYLELNLIEVVNQNNENIKVGFSTDSNFKAIDFKKGDKVYISGVKISDELFQAKNVVIVD